MPHKSQQTTYGDCVAIPRRVCGYFANIAQFGNSPLSAVLQIQLDETNWCTYLQTF
jgi:hypothetical protein